MGELAFGYFYLLIKVKVTRHQATSIKMGRRRPSLKPNFSANNHINMWYNKPAGLVRFFCARMNECVCGLKRSFLSI
jgi:hypothetical protein|tara:strand:+ start:14194 stop:14424 length:231 start_codon:yes stop_codon:yes gene_type:complete